MALVGADGRFAHANRTLGELLGCEPGALAGRFLPEFVLADDREEESASRRALMQRAGGRGPAGGDADTVQLGLRHASGRVVRALLIRRVVRDAAGIAGGLLDQVQDLTERQRAEKEIVLLNNLLEQRIRRRTAELEASNEDLRSFAHSLAHDLRGPLASIDGFSAQLERALADSLDDRSAHYLRRVRAGVRQMSDLTDGLLALADLARTELRHESVDLSRLARAIAARLRDHEPARDVEIVIEDTAPAAGDPRLLGNVMENLLGNAWKFSALKSPARIRFWSDAMAEGGSCWHVEDNGAGFDPAFAPKLFNPFQRLHASTEFEGHGIGLALVRKIVARHGGRIWADGAAGRGAVFHFTLDATGPLAGP
jgi:PAS domain S-box-containing protein